MSCPGVGIRLVISGLALPVGGFFAGIFVPKVVCEPAYPANQSETILAAGILGVSILVAILLVVMGICILLESDCEAEQVERLDEHGV